MWRVTHTYVANTNVTQELKLLKTDLFIIITDQPQYVVNHKLSSI